MTITWEKPYKYGQRPVPSSKEAYLADIRERRRWNDGGTGTLLAPLPGPDGHPDPRVIINIDRIRGGHDRKAVLRLARRNHWIHIVRCYRLGAYKDQQMRGWTRAYADINAAGRVSSAKWLDSELPDEAVSRCMADKLTQLKMPRAGAGSRVWFAMRVAPGDEPQPPPKDVLEPGEGTLDEADIVETVKREMPALERCYRAAFAYAPQLWGRIVLRLHVTRRGKVDEAFQGESRFPDKKMLQCVLKAARGWSFTQPKRGDLRFELPLRFSTTPPP